ncbi:DinB family protein [Lysinibacillus fusiformis]|uniref:PadR family transcriptional regulator n=1 Tax=Lysinibacillus fusiformis TaxID=28031 RepID=A0A1E4R7A6_9BACI|nr:DinB family protein [Lysinibacillus fusiformis]MBD8521167.1 DinB family protein [Lysinibacillus fusiformis]ODV56352.1 PadR family transcriptional regulator [Lysinibacillus fusiformis]
MILFAKDQFDATREQLLQEINHLSDTEFNDKPDAQNWSIAQICHHLILVEEATKKAVTWGLKSQEQSSPERKDMQLLLDRTRKFQAPSIVEPSEEPFHVQKMVESLATTRAEFLGFLETIEDTDALAKRTVKHPALGECPLDQWIEQIYLHEQRHIQQIQEIKNSWQQAPN